MKPSELRLPYDQWQAIDKPLDPAFRAWLAAWQSWDLACSPMNDAERSLIRYGHYLGWFACRLDLCYMSPRPR